MMPNYKQVALIFKALSDETRLRIIEMLKGGELCACMILEHFNITQPTLSYHMKILTESGLVNARRDGAWMRYSINNDGFETVRTFCTEFCGSIGNHDSLNFSEMRE
ncbi:hypothetical protein SDC9_157476 [bioreactor metagenome]|uniref:HTH arsR-type domain-containing protein n=1 Tax=bioreactor metagenome TaxID=1076179 RepID=A0A645F7B8_9ZZZZ